MPCSIARFAAPSADKAAAYGVLFRDPLEAGDPGGAPADDRAVEVRDRDDGVVEGGLDVDVPLGHVLLLTPTLLDDLLAFRHAWSVPRHFLRRTPTVFFGPRRWRALVFVR